VYVAGSTLLYSRYPLSERLGRLADLGFEAVDLAAFEGWTGPQPSELAADADVADGVADAVAASGLDPVAINAGLGDADRVGRVRAVAGLADRLGAPVVTVQAGGTETDRTADIARVEELAAAVAGYDATLTVETHVDTHTETPAGARAYADVLPLTLDPSHFVVRGHPAVPDGVVDAVAHVHVRQAGDSWEAIQRPPASGRLDVPGLVETLRTADYDGALTVEYLDSLDGVDPDEAEAGAAAMRRLLE
jgi:sugar phosphate isomerase/epimerase